MGACRECEGEGGRWAGHQAPQGLRAVVPLRLLSLDGRQASDQRHNVIRFAFEKIPPDSLVIANNDDMMMMIKRLHLYRGRSLQSIFTSSTLPSAP